MICPTIVQRALCVTAALVLATSAQGVAGQEAPTNAGNRSKPPLSSLRKVAESVGECTVRKKDLHDDVVKFVISGEERDGEGLQTVGCFASALSENGVRNYALAPYGTLALQALLADGLVRTDYAEKGPVDFQAVAPLDHSPPRGSKLTKEVETARKLSAELGECTARVSPEEVRKLALSDAASPEEMVQIRALVPTFSQCLPPNVQLAFPPNVLRDASVLAYARLALASEGKGTR